MRVRLAPRRSSVVRVSDDLPGIVACAQDLPDEIIEAELSGPAYFNRAVHRSKSAFPCRLISIYIQVYADLMSVTLYCCTMGTSRFGVTLAD